MEKEDFQAPSVESYVEFLPVPTRLSSATNRHQFQRNDDTVVVAVSASASCPVVRTGSHQPDTNRPWCCSWEAMRGKGSSSITRKSNSETGWCAAGPPKPQ